MEHYWSLDPIQLHDAWLTIGSFDGVHRGHQEIIRKLTAGAHAVGVPAVVLTFHPHPASVLGKRKDAFYLSTPEERAELLGALGVDVVITHPFNKQVAAMGAREFMGSIDAHLHLQKLWVGHDFALGRGREGDIPTLRRIGQELGYQVEEIPPIRLDGEIISSSLIRSLLGSGDVEQAGNLLGRPYRLSGRVVPGDGRGRLIGVPTANLSIWTELMLPRAGVYVNLAIIQGKIWKAVTNVGVRPTFETQPVPPRVEAHILDFNEDLYGQEIHLDFISRLRDELRFSSVQALIEQMQKDILQTREVLA